ncbi:uncharacterized protein PgNI_01314 [Pyricularia grisea]|uniref:Uncharacterized protein n=1 Tax=Pyricularia grisea TaxID=148305 RepID=A0A6P8BJ50_PYRGI|nr:uncharacterized protein PgNI_01314 [Pyricularia grisea]TLD16715.1 hypothetical protein PgNI_01314 [Pyricularia grisea]
MCAVAGVILLDNLLGSNVVAVATTSVDLVLDGDLAQVGEDVLHHGVLGGALLAAEVVQALPAGHDVVDDTNDDDDGDGVDPDQDDGDNVDGAVLRQVLGQGGGDSGLAETTREPTETSEEGGEDVNTEDGADELPRREGVEATGDEDEPVLSKGDLEEEDLLDAAVVLDDTAVLEPHGTAEDPGAYGEQSTEDDGDDPDLGQLPLDGTALVVGVVVSDGDGGKISEQGQEDDQVDTNSLVDGDLKEQDIDQKSWTYHGRDEVDLEMETESDTVLDVSLHALEDLPGDLDSRHDCSETGGEEDNVSSGLGSLGGTLDSDTTVGLLQGRGIVDTVTSHGSEMATLLKHFDDLVLVLGENFGKTISALAKVVDSAASHVAVEELVRVVNLGTHGKHAAGLLGDSNGVTSKHLDGETESLSLSDGLGGILTGRVEEGKHAKHLPGAIGLLDGNSERTETTAGELGGLLLEETLLLVGAVADGKDGVGCTLAASVLDALVVADRGNTLGDGVEGSELLGGPALRNHLLGLGVALEGEDGDLVDGVEGLDVVARGESSDSHHPVDVNALHDERLADRKLVSGKSTSLVGAENVDTGKRLDSGELLNNSLLLGEVSGTDGEGGGGNDGQTDGDTNNEQNKNIVKQVDGAVLGVGNSQVTVETTNPGSEDENDDENQESRTDRVHDGLEVTLVLSTLDERGGLSDERGLGAVGDDTVGLSALASGGVVDGVGHVLVDGERLSSDGRLVNGNNGVADVGSTILVIRLVLLAAGAGNVLGVEFGLVLGEAVPGIVVVADKTGIAGNNMAFLNDDDVTRDKLPGADLLFTAVTDDAGLHGDVTLEGGDDIGGLLLLVPTDDGVKQQDTDNDTGIDPVLKGKGKDSSSLHDYRTESKNGTLEETNELEKHVLLLGGELVPSRVLASPLNLEGVKTGRNVGVEPLSGGVEVRKALGGTLGPPESPPGGLLDLIAL